MGWATCGNFLIMNIKRANYRVCGIAALVNVYRRMYEQVICEHVDSSYNFMKRLC